MDDIYADLENYDEFNTIEELRNENKQLKCKLEECAVIMDNLKKDYDKLTSEYKHLERNYSSLLKTARAEIERKTNRITQLNKEKDMMILNSIQNRNKNLLNITRNMHISTKQDKTVHAKNRKGDRKKLKNNNKIEETNIEHEKESLECERKEENKTNSEDAGLKRNIDSNVEENIHKFTQSHRYNKTDIKDNKEQGNRLYKDDGSTADIVRANTNNNRRKSVSDMRKEENKTNSEDTGIERNTDSNIENTFVEENIHKFTQSRRYNKRDTKDNKEQGNRLYKDDGSTADTVRTSNIENTFDEENIHKFTKSRRYNKRDTRDNKEQGNRLYKDDGSTADTVRTNKINNRRKSVSDMRNSRFNSEECVDKYVAEANTWNLPLTSTTHVNESVERKNDDRRSNKISETSSIDDKSSDYHEAREENYYKNKRRQYEIDKHRHRDKYEPYSRYRRPGSSERFHPRAHHSQYDEQQSRIEHDKYRIDNSLFDRHHYQRRNHERRSNYERDYSYDHERNYHDTHPMKHKIENDYEGPQNKRIRTNSYNKYTDEDQISYKEPEFVDEIDMPISMKNIQYTTCQSPDYTPIDSGFSNPVREVMDTAVAYLEDPRVTSKKYTMKTENNNTFLSTITARNVDIKVIDKSLWQIDTVKVPEPLLHHPSKYSQQMIDDIYLDVDNPVSNISVESGEIIDFDNLKSHCTSFVYTTDHETERRKNILKKQETENIRNSNAIETSNHYQSNENNTASQLNPVDLPDVIEKSQDYGNVNKQTNEKETKDIEKKMKESTTNEGGSTTTRSNYRIPKLKKSNKHSPHLLNSTDVGLSETENQRDENAKRVSDIENERNISNNESCIDYVGTSLETLQKKHENDNKKFEENIDKDKLSYINTLTLNNEDRKPVDTLCDISSTECCIDYVGKSLKILQNKPENGNKNIEENFDKDNLSCINTLNVGDVDRKPVNPLSDYAVEDNDIVNVEFDSKYKKSVTLGGFVAEDLELSNDSIDHEDLQKQNKKSVEEIPRSDKKHTTKKKENTKQEQISSKDPSERTRLEDAINIKSKAKKEPTEIKTKYSVQFGDTSSLILPEDLGYPISQTQNPTSTIYGPVYEDAQNAVDFDMKEMIEVKMRSFTSSAENILIQEKLITSDSISKNNETEEERRMGPPLETINIAKVNTERRTKSKKIEGTQNTVDLDMEEINTGQILSSKLGVENRLIEEKQILSHMSENYGTEEKSPKTAIKVSIERRKCKKIERTQNLDYDIKKTNQAQIPPKPTIEIEEKQTESHDISENNEMIEKPPMTITNIAKVNTERRRKSRKSVETENAVDVNMKEVKKAKMRSLKSVDNALIEDKQTETHIISENNETEESQPLSTINVAKVITQRRKSKKSEAQNVNEDVKVEMNKGQMLSPKCTAENILIEEKQTVSHNILESNETDEKQSVTTTNIAKVNNSKISEGPNLATATETSETANEYINLNSELALSIESDIHKTVIISTGIQNRYTSDNILEPTTNVDANVNKEQDIISKNDIIGTSIIALATSTPYKTLEALQYEIHSQPLDFSSNPSEGKIKHDIPAVTVTNVPTSHISDSRPDADEPDIRLVVKRRRRVLKKSPVNG